MPLCGPDWQLKLVRSSTEVEVVSQVRVWQKGDTQIDDSEEVDDSGEVHDSEEVDDYEVVLGETSTWDGKMLNIIKHVMERG